MEELSKILDDTRTAMQKSYSHAEDEFSKIRAGKANPSMLDGLMVDYYGNPTPLNQVANVTTPDARTILVQPWEKAMIQHIEKAIIDANLGLTPGNDGNVVRINIPILTEERRKQLVKQLNNEAENARIAIRNIRKDSNEKIKKEQKNGLPEDLAKEGEAKVQTMTDQFSAKINSLAEVKEKEIMTV
jgi:ribosome recycling factor